MKKKLCLIVLTFMFFIIPSSALASPVYETTGWITGTEGVTFDFTVDTPPSAYVATITDLSVEPYFGFDFLFLSISTGSQFLGSVVVDPTVGYAILPFDAIPIPPESEMKIFANIFGKGGGNLGSGNFGLQVNAIPVPSALILFGSGIFALFALKRRK
jgi:hypothetical protein